jgi:hypothetical protein
MSRFSINFTALSFVDIIHIVYFYTEIMSIGEKLELDNYCDLITSLFSQTNLELLLTGQSTLNWIVLNFIGDWNMKCNFSKLMSECARDSKNIYSVDLKIILHFK